MGRLLLRHASHEPELLALDGIDLDIDFAGILGNVHKTDLAIHGQLVVGDHLGDFRRSRALGLGLEQVGGVGTTRHGLLEVLRPDEDLLLVRVDAELLGAVDDVAERQDVGDERDGGEPPC